MARIFIPDFKAMQSVVGFECGMLALQATFETHKRQYNSSISEIEVSFYKQSLCHSQTRWSWLL